jgi:hypothetical protein
VVLSRDGVTVVTGAPPAVEICVVTVMVPESMSVNATDFSTAPELDAPSMVMAGEPGAGSWYWWPGQNVTGAPPNDIDAIDAGVPHIDAVTSPIDAEARSIDADAPPIDADAPPIDADAPPIDPALDFGLFQCVGAWPCDMT